MSDNPKEDILKQPEFPMLVFGDGYEAILAGSIEYEEENGIKWRELIIEPTELLRKRYDIKDSELNKNHCIIIRAKSNDLIPLNPFDASNNKILYIKNYKGEDTNISDIGWDLRKRLEEEQKKRRILEGENTFYSEQLLLAKTNPVEFMAQPLEIFKQITESAIDALKTKKEKEE